MSCAFVCVYVFLLSFSCVYSHLSETAQSQGGNGDKDAVLAVPGDFTAEQRNAAR